MKHTFEVIESTELPNSEFTIRLDDGREVMCASIGEGVAQVGDKSQGEIPDNLTATSVLIFRP